MISGLISFKLLDNLFQKFRPYPHPFEFDPFTCSGTIESWLIAGSVVTTAGNPLTLKLWRRVKYRTVNVPIVISEATVGLGDIRHTNSPNVYRISIPASQFAFRRNDYIEIVYVRTGSSQFTISYLVDETPEELQNVNLMLDSSGILPIFPLLSLVVSGKDKNNAVSSRTIIIVSTGDDCNGNIFYNPDVLANRAQLLEVITTLPLHPIANANAGHLYIFPNISFPEKGRITLWRFAAGINNHVLPGTELQYPSLQVWRNNGQELSLVTSTINSMAPSLELETLNVYRYECNLAYQAGDFIAVYQPPVPNSRYLLVVVDTRDHLSPTVAYHREVLDTASPLNLTSYTDRSLTPFYVEPVINITINITTVPEGETILVGATPPLQTTSAQVTEPGLVIFPTIIIGTVGGLLFLLFFALVAIVLVFCILHCRKASTNGVQESSVNLYDYPGKL